MTNLNLKLTLIMFFLSSIILSGCVPDVKWDDAMSLPPCCGTTENIGVAGAYSGFVNKKLIVTGGANFPEAMPWDGGKKTWHQTAYCYNTENNKWSIIEQFLPIPLGYGVSVHLPEGLLCIGGCDINQCYAETFLITEINDTITTIKYPALPIPMASMTGTCVNGCIYIAGGQEAMKPEISTTNFFKLDPKNLDAGWQKLPSWPGESRGYAVSTECNGKFYLFSGRSYNSSTSQVNMHTDGFVYDPASEKWEKLQGEFPVMAGTAFSVGEMIYFVGGVSEILPTNAAHPGFDNVIRVFDTNKAKFVSETTLSFPIPVTTNIAKNGNKVYISSGEIRPGVRTPKIVTGHLK